MKSSLTFSLLIYIQSSNWSERFAEVLLEQRAVHRDTPLQRTGVRKGGDACRGGVSCKIRRRQPDRWWGREVRRLGTVHKEGTMGGTDRTL